MIQTAYDLESLRSWRNSLKGSVGFVPTMGALHIGHGALLEKARQENDHVVLSVFVNPTQFDKKEDLEKYPSTLQQDIELAEKVGVDLIWVPTYPQLYPDGFKYKITEQDLSMKFCGAHRPGHFDGVLSIVMKLFNLVRPHCAYFGEKDYQQLTLIQGLVEAFFLDVKIIPVATVREESGLAYSSRNVHLSSEDKKIAPKLFEIIKNSSSAEEARHQLTEAGLKIDYVEDYGPRRLAAAYLGTTRLIDNVELK